MRWHRDPEFVAAYDALGDALKSRRAAGTP
jgi:hypothetical protein